MSSRVRAALVVLVGAGVLAGMAGGLARVRLDTTVGSFLPSGDPAVRAWQAEQRSFGADPIAVVLTADKPGQLLSGAPLRKEVRLEGELAGLPDTAAVYGPGTTLNEIARSLQGLLASISGDRDALMTRAEVAARKAGKSPSQQAAAGRAAVYRFDLRYGALLARGLKIGLPTLANPNFGPAVLLGPHGQGRSAFR
ncbi:MAG TPA: hypothetical protein VE152_04635, partial [Acidimicrobiales bacterium]|nr:hypothetical protein [Acidimicrobiales bacterium]